MPWLVREEEVENKSDALLFVHVPRCGGTSLTKHFNLASKSVADKRCCIGKFGIIYFAYRYRMLESANFPWKTYENLYAVIVFIAGVTLAALLPSAFFFFMFSHPIMVAFSSTYLFTAPVLTYTLLRRWQLWSMAWLIQGYSEKYLYGGNMKGVLMHMTGQRLVYTHLVSKEEFKRVSSFAIVRNPFSRMVSVYMYNRFGPLESFPKFVRRVQSRITRLYEARRERGATEPIREWDWDAYCHLLPQHEFTHMPDGSQLVRFVIKQEEHKSLRTDSPAPSVRHLTPAIREALLSMPHANFRKRQKNWKDYYDEETEEIVRLLYMKDFEVFGYPTMVNGDSVAPVITNYDSDPPEGGWPPEPSTIQMLHEASQVVHSWAFSMVQPASSVSEKGSKGSRSSRSSRGGSKCRASASASWPGGETSTAGDIEKAQAQIDDRVLAADGLQQSPVGNGVSTVDEAKLMAPEVNVVEQPPFVAKFPTTMIDGEVVCAGEQSGQALGNGGHDEEQGCAGIKTEQDGYTAENERSPARKSKRSPGSQPAQPREKSAAGWEDRNGCSR